MGTIVPLPTTHISSEKRGGLPKKGCYDKIPIAIISEFFKLLRGDGGPDSFIIKLYYPNNDNPVGEMLMHGCIPTKGKFSREYVYSCQLDLEAELDTRSAKAFAEINDRTSRVFKDRHHHKNMVFVKSTKGLIACGWYDSANSLQKGILMACYMLYAFGALNKSVDPILYTAIYNYLPYDGGLFTSVEAEKAERIIVKCIGDQTLAKRKN